jgi:hypothetical protein
VLELTSSVGATLSVLIIFSGVAAVAEANKVFVPELRELFDPDKGAIADISVWLTSIMTADLIITVVIIWGLTRSKTGWVNTDRVSLPLPTNPRNLS